MAGIKRKEAPGATGKEVKKQKVISHKLSKSSESAQGDETDDFGGFSEGEDGDVKIGAEEESVRQKAMKTADPTKFKLDGSSAEAHAKQRATAKERKAAKPNADAVERTKKIWERLQRKSHVPPSERKELVTELFEIIGGRIRDFVFKHDSVRVVQCALKYANMDQRRMIVDELRTDVRTLVESKYGKFLVAKMVVEGDQDIRNKIVPEFYGHVKRLMNHPEASWVIDDIYRQVATAPQKATMLREWYGAEFALFYRKPEAKVAIAASPSDTADLSKIIEETPEKRRPFLQHTLQIINSMIQKKLTGFTMLHDAMLQYFLALTPGSEEHNEFLEILKGDIETKVEAKDGDGSGGGDLFRNLAFTKSGSKLVCLAIAYGSAKDRKVILRCFKDTIELMSYDQYANMVLVTALDVPDDTKMTTKGILHDLLGQGMEDETKRLDRLAQMAVTLNSRIPLLYPLAGSAKWLMNDADKAFLADVHKIRETTSKKAPDVRRKGLIEYLSDPLLELVSKRAEKLISDPVTSSFGCQFIQEALLECDGDGRSTARQAVANLAATDPTTEGHLAHNPAAGRMLKTLVLGGAFDFATKSTKLAEPRLNFADVLYPVIKSNVVQWACGPSSFVVVALLESEDSSDSMKTEVRATLKKQKAALVTAAKAIDAPAKVVELEGSKGSKGSKKKPHAAKGNAGARKLLEMLDT